MELAHVIPTRRHHSLRQAAARPLVPEHVLHGFAAWLTEAELEAVSIKPGFFKWIPDETMYLGGNVHGNNKVIGARSHC
uniref:Uncharacterized protein n=1 Tax=Oryza punctata TaxID=4537 RepID=A0A0E0JT87_ORYPU